MWNFKSLQKPLMALFLLCLFPLGAMAQGVVKGTVNDEAGEPVIGATVKVQGSQAGSITDFDGKFSVEAGSNATLVISYVGYQTQTVKVAGKNDLVKVLGNGEIKAAVTVTAHGFSKSAIAKIEAAGGKAVVIE